MRLRNLIVVLIALIGISVYVNNAFAAPSTNRIQAWDITQSTPWPSCGANGGINCHVPKVYATSYFNTIMLSDQYFYHSSNIVWTEVTNDLLSAGRQMGIICWLVNSNGVLVDKADTRFNGNAWGNNTSLDGPPIASSLWIGYVPDINVNLSYADRVNYVPHC